MLIVHEGIEDAQNGRPTRPQVRQTPEAYPLGTLRILLSRERSSRNGASLGKEAVLADSGRAGEVAAGVGRVRSLAFLSILHGVLPLSQMCRPVKFWGTPIVFPQPARYYPFQWIALSFFPWPPAHNHLLLGGKP